MTSLESLADRVERTAFWPPAFRAGIAAEVPLDAAVALLRLSWCALLGHADQRSDVEALVPDLDDAISALAALPDDDEYRRLRRVADIADRRRADAWEMADA